MKTSVCLILAFASLCLARPDHLDDALGLFGAEDHSRAIIKPKTPNQIFDAIIQGARGYIQGLGWDVEKRLQNGYSDLPFSVDNSNAPGGKTSERFEITSAKITGLGSLRRARSASFNEDMTLLKATAVIENARATAHYQVSFSGAGEAPPNYSRGQVTEKVDKLFAAMEINLKDLVPQSIRNFSAYSGKDGLEVATNLDKNMATVDSAGFRKALRQTLTETFNKNIKVQINKAIQDMKNAAK